MPVSPCIELDEAQRDNLLVAARRAIAEGLERNSPPTPDLAGYDAVMARPHAVFVTLLQSGNLRGCIGSLEASKPLIQAVITSAFNAAFRDPRFKKLQADELNRTQIEISVLSSLQLIEINDRQSLLNSLEPELDGLLLEDQGRRATFLPKVWEKIGVADEFVGQLMLKAGLPAAYWSDSIRCYRYRTLTFAEK